MTTEPDETAALPDAEGPALSPPPVRGVVRLLPSDEPPARGRAHVRGAIDPALRHTPRYQSPPFRERVDRDDQAPDPARTRGAGSPSSPAALSPAAIAVGPRGPEPVKASAARPGTPSLDNADSSAIAARPISSVLADKSTEDVHDPTVETVAIAAPTRPKANRAGAAVAPASEEIQDPSAEVAAPNQEVPPTSGRFRRLGRGALVPVVAAILAAFVAGTGYLMVREPAAEDDIGRWTGTPQAQAPVNGDPSTAPSDEAPFAVPADGSGPDPFGTRNPVAFSGAPTRLRVTAIGVDTTLETLRLGGDGELTPPKNFAKAGYYAGGTLPGDTGPAVIAGHVDSRSGPAVFYKLREMQAGDRIEVVRGGKTIAFTVTATAWYPKAKFPTDQVYGPTPDRQLRLITCGGVFDHSLRSYRDNLVVYAVAG